MNGEKIQLICILDEQKKTLEREKISSSKLKLDTFI